MCPRLHSQWVLQNGMSPGLPPKPVLVLVSQLRHSSRTIVFWSFQTSLGVLFVHNRGKQDTQPGISPVSIPDQANLQPSLPCQTWRIATEGASWLGNRLTGMDQNGQERLWVYIPQGVGLSEGRGQLQLLNVRSSFLCPACFAMRLPFTLMKHFCRPCTGICLNILSAHVLRHCSRDGHRQSQGCWPQAWRRQSTGNGPEFANSSWFPLQSPVSPANKLLDSWKQKKLAGLLLEASAVLRAVASPLEQLWL